MKDQICKLVVCFTMIKIEVCGMLVPRVHRSRWGALRTTGKSIRSSSFNKSIIMILKQTDQLKTREYL